MLAEFVVTFMNNLMSKYTELENHRQKLVLKEVISVYIDMQV